MSATGLLQLPASPRAPGLARAHVRTCLRELGLEHLRDPVELLTTEVVTNAVLHVGDSPSVCVERWEGGVRVEVGDSSPVPPVRRRTSGTSTTGRGVHLLEVLADSWGWQPGHPGKTVWFVVTQVRG